MIERNLLNLEVFEGNGGECSEEFSLA